MKHNRLGMVLLALVWLLPVHMAMALEIKSDADAVNIAGKQRMYTMRMLKDYLMIGENLHYKDPKGDLEKTMAAFDESGKALEAYIKDPALKKEMNAINEQWEKVRKMFSEPPKKDQAAVYAKSAIDLREKLNTYVQHLAEHYGGSASQVVNHSGRLRAVSQALASVYQLKSWGLPDADKKLEIPMKRFRASLDYITNAKETQESMRPLLAKLEGIYLFFSVMGTADDTATPVLAIKRTDKMLKIANELTEKYVESLNK